VASVRTNRFQIVPIADGQQRFRHHEHGVLVDLAVVQKAHAQIHVVERPVAMSAYKLKPQIDVRESLLHAAHARH
jgi:hypothetical protein